MIITYLLLGIIAAARSTNTVSFVSKTVEVEKNVTLSCARQRNSNSQLFWIRIISGHWPEVLADTSGFKYQISSITAKQRDETLDLHINKVKLNDSGLYYCIYTELYNLIFIGGYFLEVKEPEVPTNINLPDSNPPGLQCSVLSHSEEPKCTGSPGIYWFNTDNSYANFIYTHNDNGSCDSSLKTPSTQKCFYSFSTILSDNLRIQHCAVAACGQILFGQGTQLNLRELKNDRTTITALVVLCLALIISVIILVYCLCEIKNKSRSCICSACKDLPSKRKTHDDRLVYSAPIFQKRKARKVEGNGQSSTEETIYSDVKVSVNNQ